MARKEEQLFPASNTPPRIEKSVNSKEPESGNTATAAATFRMEPEESAASFQGSVNALMAAWAEKLEAVKFTAVFDASLKAKPPLIYLYFTT